MKPVEIAHRSLLAASVLGLLALAVSACSNPPDEDQTTPPGTTAPGATTPAMATPDDVPAEVETAVDDVQTRGFCHHQNDGKVACLHGKAYICGGCFDSKGRPEKYGQGCHRAMWTRYHTVDYVCDRPH